MAIFIERVARLIGLMAFLAGITSAYANDIYVDYANGDDEHSGLSQNQPWKHAPGDPNAQANAEEYELEGGDRVLFKGGIPYYGRIVVPTDGKVNLPISYIGNGWGAAPAIIDGSIAVPGGFERCRSQDDCLGNKNWKYIFVATHERALDPFAPLFISDDRYWPAQTPNMPDPFWFDDLKSYSVVPKGSSEIQLGSDYLRMRQTEFERPVSSWEQAWIAAWLKPNKVVVAKVTGIDQARNTVFFTPQKHKPYVKRDSFYSFFNRPGDLDRPGEFLVDNKNHKILFWPYNQVSQKPNKIRVSSLSRAFDLNGKSNIRIEGFEIRNFLGGLKEWQSGTAIINYRKTSKNIEIRDNIVKNLRSAEGVGAIQIHNAENVIIANNRILDSQKNSGIRLAKSRNGIIEKNEISRIGRTGIRLIGNHHVRISDNYLEKIKGVHGNGMSVYLENVDVLVANNVVIETPSAFTYHGARVPDKAYNLWILNNQFFGRVNSWGKKMAGVYIYHNLFFAPNERKKSLQIPDKDRRVSVQNNIIDGWLRKGSPVDWIVSNNLYTSLSIFQNAKYKWILEDGAEVERSLARRLLEGSFQKKNVETQTGVKVINTLPVNLFPEFDFSYWTVQRPVGPRKIRAPN